ncbi:uncharacterized protein LOC100833991 [Brachypodium distachyon]|uniref:uncharacterized protein LOC100833991 n=1 Tax=Brachypodium distachyon TaxID=15368 RepID=UPI00071C29B1|nr:uncharacterized protein LOC100833991 [Brachypodium distachyon]|eukprot:XP_014754093.1 uncharacterized protein LOC100833991 [Brachypodium distachyon]
MASGVSAPRGLVPATRRRPAGGDNAARTASAKGRQPRLHGAVPPPAGDRPRRGRPAAVPRPYRCSVRGTVFPPSPSLILPSFPQSSIQPKRTKTPNKPSLSLCSDPAIRKRSPQTLSGFFFNRTRGGLTFRNLSVGGSRRSTPLIDPKLPFLRGTYKRLEVEQGCGSVLLLRCWKSYTKRNKDKYDHVVCNPATEEWRVLPLIVLPDQEKPDVLVFYDGD